MRHICGLCHLPRSWLCHLRFELPRALHEDHRLRNDRLMTSMAAIYKPTEAIRLLQPVSKRSIVISRRRCTARVAFSTSRHSRATQSSTNSPPPQPTRRSVTVTNDTGVVRWSELSPGEKAARTVQQSFNLSVVVVGVLLTVRYCSTSLSWMSADM